jgi:Uma2 family endonuclease
MSARPQFAPADQMTVEEYLGFTATRPDEERWELIEGVPVLSPSPVEFHQVVASNIVTFLMNEKRRVNASWLPMIGVGTRVSVSPNSLPQPDVSVKDGPATDRPETTDALVLFEVLSPSNTKADQAWRRKVYASIPNCQHYVTVSLKRVEVTVYDRSSGWKARGETALEASLELPALGLSMPLADVYRYVPLGE